MAEVNNSGGGLGLAGTLTLIFVVLKLTNNIDWNWWWVLSPLFAGFGITVLLIIFVLFIEIINESKGKL